MAVIYYTIIRQCILFLLYAVLVYTLSNGLVYSDILVEFAVILIDEGKLLLDLVVNNIHEEDTFLICLLLLMSPWK